MNTHVDFETAKLLKEKGFDLECYDYYTLKYDKKKAYKTKGIEYQSDKYIKFDWNCNSESAKSIKAPYPNNYHESQCSAPTIAAIVMWLYEKHGIWIAVDLDDDNTFVCVIRSKSTVHVFDNTNSPTEAYQEAITYTLNNLV